jgi:sugar O-acyltransferase (sialic acid O-acetyltransferase NeuD family)
MNNDLVIVGAGAHARKLWHYSTTLGLKVKAFVDDSSQAISPCAHIPCISVWEASAFGEGQHFVVAMGNPVARKRLLEGFEEKGWTAVTLIHPTAYVAPDAIIQAGVVVCAQAVVETKTYIGIGAIVDVGAIVDHDCVVGAYSHLMAGCLLRSYTRIDDGQSLGSELDNR